MNPASSAAATTEGQTGSRFGVWVALVGAVLAFLLASTPTRQTDVWSHLARGRALAAGDPPPARNPQLLSPDDDRREYSSALYDLGLYAGFRSLGGSGVAGLNAALAAILALVAFRAGRSAGRPEAVGACIVLSVLAVGPWLDFSPRLLSYLFWALTIVLLRAAVENAESETGGGRVRWSLLVLIAVWANVDRWVVLGPIAVGLLALAQWYRGRGRAARSLGRLFVAAVAVSLLSPNQIWVWDLERTLWSAPDAPPSPFWPAWYRSGPLAVGGIYVLLVLFGLLAFRADPRMRIRAWAPLWLLLLGLAIGSPAAAPFFAVVAGPIAAWGLAGPRRTAPSDGKWPRWIIRLARPVGWVLAPLAAVALLAAAWAGYITGPPFGRPTWSVTVDDSLRDAVGEIVRLRQEGVFGADTHGLTLSPEVAAYWSWFGPRSGTEPARQEGNHDVARVQAGILGEADHQPRPDAGWREILRTRRVNHLILHLGSNLRIEQVVTRLSGWPEECPLLYLRGRTAVFGWRDPASRVGGDPLDRLRLSVQRRAFVPAPNDRAPADGPGREPGERAWSRAFVEPLHGPPPDRDEAALYTAYFDGHRGGSEVRNRTDWLASQRVRLVGNLAGPLPTAGSVAAGIGQWAIGVPGDWDSYVAHQDEGPLGALLLAVRAARRAIRADPDDAKSYFVLGEAYLRLAQVTRERAWRYHLPAFDRIRQVQAITAFQHVLALRPDSPAAHGRLARLYRDRGSLDLALGHLDRLLAISKARGPQPAEKPESSRDAIGALERERDELAAVVRQREERLDAGRENRKILDLAREAAAVGLPRRALEILLKSDASEFGAEGAQLELDLLLWAGRVRDVRAWLDPALEKTIGAVTYHEVLACLAAATGDYREAGEEMRGVATALSQVPSRLPTPYKQASYDIVRAVLANSFVGGNPAGATHQLLVRQGLLVEVQQIASGLGREADALVVAGLLALESGDVPRAEDLLNRALIRWQSEDGSREAGVDFSGRTVAQDCLHLIAAHRAGG